MDPRDSDPLLAELARLPEPEGDVPSDELLAAYRRGELPPEEQERLERRLARSSAARLKLLALAGPVAPARPGEAVRSQVLASFAAARRSRSRRLWGLAAAAALVLGAGLPWLYRATRAPLPAYHVLLSGGQAEVRGAGDGGLRQEIRAFPEQEVGIRVAPEERREARMEIGLYRVEAGRLERLDGGGFTDGREGAALSRPAAALAGTVPGRYPLYLAVARPGDLPEDGAAAPGGDPESLAAALAAGGRRQVSTFYLTILQPDPPFPVPGELP